MWLFIESFKRTVDFSINFAMKLEIHSYLMQQACTEMHAKMHTHSFQCTVNTKCLLWKHLWTLIHVCFVRFWLGFIGITWLSSERVIVLFWFVLHWNWLLAHHMRFPNRFQCNSQIPISKRERFVNNSVSNHMKMLKTKPTILACLSIWFYIQRRMLNRQRNTQIGNCFCCPISSRHIDSWQK